MLLLRMVMCGFVLVGWIASQASAAMDRNVVMPEELVEYAASNNCAQVSDFFARREMVDPPYAYGYLRSKKEDSAVFWCQTGKGDERRFWLVVMQRDVARWRGACPRKLEWKASYPKGLRISAGVAKSLDDFYVYQPVYDVTPARQAPKGAKPTENFIVSEYAGTRGVLYCYRGQWFVRRDD